MARRLHSLETPLFNEADCVTATGSDETRRKSAGRVCQGAVPGYGSA